MVGTLATSSNATGGMTADLLIILAAAGLVAVLLQRARVALIPVYLVTGAIIGPGGLKLIATPERVTAIGDLAIILLLFGIGLHMDLSNLTQGLRRLLVAGIGSIIGAVLLIWPAARLLDLSLPSALAVAIALCMSSTAVVLRIVQQRRELHHAEGRLSFAILILQDLAAIVALMLLPALARWNGRVSAAEGAPESAWATFLDLGLHTLIAAVGMTILVLTGRFLLPRLLHEAARNRATEAMTVVSTAAALGAAALTNLVGLNPALGAFLGGFLLSSTPFRHHLSGQIGTLRDLFSAVFFTAIGMTVELNVVIHNLPVILIGTLMFMSLKALATMASCWISGSTGNVCVKTGLMLAQAGEFSVVVLGASAANDMLLLPKDTVVLLVTMVVLSLMVTPWMITAGHALSRKLPPIPAPPWAQLAKPGAHTESAQAGAPPRRVIVAGYGLVGRVVADALTAQGADVTIIELNPSTARRQSLLGRRVLFGDASNPEVLESAGVHDANALILTIPDEESVLRACHTARSSNPHIFILARTNYVSKGMLATGLGANDVVIEELATAEAMERAVVRVFANVGNETLARAAAGGTLSRPPA